MFKYHLPIIYINLCLGTDYTFFEFESVMKNKDNV